MDNFIVSARKYRPTTFDNVVGQGSITATLKNAIKTGHLAQAYLFCGPRGVGKTTCARIFAKIINCQSLSPNIEPCNQCESCVSFNESRSYNVHELDAASNNSVEDIRQLIEKVRIPPPIGRYSVYVIDEVHMLSQAAFNAFLKTLEEPPRHAIFILATTEKHKILPTILSRCQIFDFNRIRVNDITDYLVKISEKENNEYDLDGLNIIAQKADGALRDALSIYDQIVSFSNGKITYENVIKSLNVLDYDYYFKLTDAFLDENVGEAMVILDEILTKGFNIQSFIEGLSKHYRDLLISRDKATINLLEVSENIKNKYLTQTARCPVDFLYDCLEILSDCELQLKDRRNQRLFVEITFVKLCRAINKKKILSSRPENTGIAAPPTAETKTNSINNNVSKNSVSSTYANHEEKKNTPNPIGVSTPSLKKLLNFQKNQASASNETVQDENAARKEIKNHPATEQQILSAFQDYVEKLKDSNIKFYSILQEPPAIINNTTIQIKFLNKTLLDDFLQTIKEDMINSIRSSLNNDNLWIDAVLVDSDQQTMPYTAEEKLKYFISKNSAIINLKQQLNLDVE
jgi:DNA polymerase-3 subunit gamma/tau